MPFDAIGLNLLNIHPSSVTRLLAVQSMNGMSVEEAFNIQMLIYQFPDPTMHTFFAGMIAKMRILLLVEAVLLFIPGIITSSYALL